MPGHIIVFRYGDKFSFTIENSNFSISAKIIVSGDIINTAVAVVAVGPVPELD
jgi:hypothetical protein